MIFFNSVENKYKVGRELGHLISFHIFRKISEQLRGHQVIQLHLPVITLVAKVLFTSPETLVADLYWNPT